MTDEALTCVPSRQLIRRVGRLTWVRSAVEAGYDTLAWVSGLVITAGAAGPDGPRMTRAVLTPGHPVYRVLSVTRAFSSAIHPEAVPVRSPSGPGAAKSIRSPGWPPGSRTEVTWLGT